MTISAYSRNGKVYLHWGPCNGDTSLTVAEAEAIMEVLPAAILAARQKAACATCRHWSPHLPDCCCQQYNPDVKLGVCTRLKVSDGYVYPMSANDSCQAYEPREAE